MFKSVLLRFILLVVAVNKVVSQCKNVTTQAGFNLDEYISAKWYSHQQRPTPFQTEELFYCVSAEYDKIDPTDPPQENFDAQYTISVLNVAQDAEGKVFTSNDDVAVGPNPGPLCGLPDKEANDPAKLLVGNCFVSPDTPFAAGPYWVLAYDEVEGYALISGGQPDVEKDGLCSYSSPFSGLWIFQRSSERDEDLIQTARNIALEQGIDVSILKDVNQINCSEDTPSPSPAPTEAAPTEAPTKAPTKAPTGAPTEAPTKAPTKAPTGAPTEAPTKAPTGAPTKAPTKAPTGAPDEPPTMTTQRPTRAPSVPPEEQPTAPVPQPTSAAKPPTSTVGSPTPGSKPQPTVTLKEPVSDSVSDDGENIDESSASEETSSDGNEPEESSESEVNDEEETGEESKGKGGKGKGGKGKSGKGHKRKKKNAGKGSSKNGGGKKASGDHNNGKGGKGRGKRKRMHWKVRAAPKHFAEARYNYTSADFIASLAGNHDGSHKRP